MPPPTINRELVVVENSSNFRDAFHFFSIISSQLKLESEKQSKHKIRASRIPGIITITTALWPHRSSSWMRDATNGVAWSFTTMSPTKWMNRSRSRLGCR